MGLMNTINFDTTSQVVLLWAVKPAKQLSKSRFPFAKADKCGIKVMMVDSEFFAD